MTRLCRTVYRIFPLLESYRTHVSAKKHYRCALRLKYKCGGNLGIDLGPRLKATAIPTLSYGHSYFCLEDGIFYQYLSNARPFISTSTRDSTVYRQFRRSRSMFVSVTG